MDPTQPLTPDNLAAPLPDITGALNPVNPVPDCGLFGDLNGMIAANPGIAVAILFGAFIFLWPKKGRR